MNNAILSTRERNGVVVVFVDYSNFICPVLEKLGRVDLINDTIQPLQKAVFLGYFHCSKTIGRLGMEQEEYNQYIADQPFYDSLKTTDKAGYSFLKSPFYELLLSGLLNVPQQTILAEAITKTRTMEKCVVNEDDKKTITYDGVPGIDHDAESESPFRADIVRYHIKNLIWKRYPEPNHDDNSPESLTVAPRNDSFRIKDTTELVYMMIFAAAAEAMRNRRDSIVYCLAGSRDPKIKYAHPLLTDTSKRLGVSLQVTPVPHPTRDYNVIPLTLRSQVLLDYPKLEFGQRLLCTDMLEDEMSNESQQGTSFRQAADLFFQAILIRCTGRSKLFTDLWYTSLNQKRGGIIPSRDELPRFLQFVHETCLHSHGRMNHWISDQHAGNIPQKLWNVHSFSMVFTWIAQEIAIFLESIAHLQIEFAGGSDSASTETELTDCASTWPQVMLLLEVFLLRAFGDVINDDETDVRARASKTLQRQCEFLSYQCMADLDCVLYNPFGVATIGGVVLGIGSDEGFRLIQSNIAMTGSWANRKVQCFQECLDSVRGLPENCLTVLGLERRHCGTTKNESSVFVIINGRQVGFIDVEHYACKGKIMLANIHPSRLCAARPFASKHYCRPFPNKHVYWESEQVDALFSNVVNSFEENQALDLPDVCKMWLELIESNAQENPRDDPLVYNQTPEKGVTNTMVDNVTTPTQQPTELVAKTITVTPLTENVVRTYPVPAQDTPTNNPATRRMKRHKTTIPEPF
jgi:hypothetical protein